MRRIAFLLAALVALSVFAEPVLAIGVAVRAGRVGVRVGGPHGGVAVRGGPVAVRPVGPAVRVGPPVVRPVPRPVPVRPVHPIHVRPVPPVVIGW